MTGSKFLIIDDDRDFADGLALALELFGHQADVAFTGERGIEAARENAYDTILIDIRLPGLNGIDSLLKIKHSNPETRCFLLTGYSADHVAERGIEAGAIEILTKPIDPNELLRRIATAQSQDG